MAINYHPQVGQLLMCDFSQGFSEPEMVKHRPVVVLTPAMAGRDRLVTVAACSTQPPKLVGPHHLLLPKRQLPQLGFFQKPDTWLKGDMIYAVAFHRLELIRLNKKGADGSRLYFVQPFPPDLMKQVRACVLHGLTLSVLVPHL